MTRSDSMLPVTGSMPLKCLSNPICSWKGSMASRARAARAANCAEQKVEHLQEFSIAGLHAGMRDTSGASTAFYLKPSIAVLPLRNLSGELDHDHISEGLVEDLVEALARIPYLFVVSRLSAASFRTLDRTPLGRGEA